MKSQIVILKVNFEDDDRIPKNWDWNSLIGCKDCIELLNFGAVEAKNEEK